MRFTDVTEDAGVAGTGYSMGAAAGDYDNDGHVDLFVAGVFRNTLYHNRGDGHFDDVTKKAGIKSDKKAVAAGWFDYNNDGLLDLFVVNTIVSAATLRATCEFIATRRTSRASPTRFTVTGETGRLKMSPSEPGSPSTTAGG